MRIDGHTPQFIQPDASRSLTTKLDDSRALTGAPESTSNPSATLTSSSAFGATPEIRHERIEILKQQVAAGTYRMDASRVAEAMIAAFNLK